MAAEVIRNAPSSVESFTLLAFEERLRSHLESRLQIRTRFADLGSTRAFLVSPADRGRPNGLVIDVRTGAAERIYLYVHTAAHIALGHNMPLITIVEGDDETASDGLRHDQADGLARANFARKVDNNLYVRDYAKCILCYKCVEACGEDAQNTFAIALAGRGFDARISTEWNVGLPDSACVYCGNCIAVCPTGALMFSSEHEMRAVRGAGISLVFQEPMTALNPVMTCGDQIDEVLRFHTGLSPRERRSRILEIIREVSLPDPALVG